MTPRLPLAVHAALAPALLAALASCQDPRDQPSALMLARTQSAATGRPILAFVAPRDGLGDPAQAVRAAALREAMATRLRKHARMVEDDELRELLPVRTHQEQFLTAMHHLLLSDDPEVLRMLIDAHLVVLRFVDAPRSAKPAERDQNLLLLDARGQRVAGVRVDPLAETSVADGARRLLDLHDRTSQRQPKGTEDQLAAAAKMLRVLRDDQADTTTEQQIGEYQGILAASYAQYAPLIHSELGTAIGIYRERLQRVLEIAAMYRGQRGDLLPFGLEWDGAQAEPPRDPCPGCGMALRITDVARRIVLADR